jgi:hypothetical protein
MAITKEQISFQVDKAIEKQISKSKLQAATAAAGMEAIRIIRERTGQGINLEGRRMPKLTRSYRKQKQKYIRSGIPRRYGDTTEYEAKNLPNHIRLTGQMFSDLDYQVTQAADYTNKAAISFRIYVRSRSAEKVGWLAAKRGRNKYKSYRKASRTFFGISTRPDRREKETERILEAFLKALGQRNAEIVDTSTIKFK